MRLHSALPFISLLCTGTIFAATEPLAKFDGIKPNTLYEVNFVATPENEKLPVSWELRFYNEQKQIPEDGKINGIQTTFPVASGERKLHKFRVRTTDATTHGVLNATNIKDFNGFVLEEVADGNLLDTPAQFSTSELYSGFAERSQTDTRFDENKRLNLLTAAERGYFITNFIPIDKAGEYQLENSPVRSNFAIFYYDDDKNFINTSSAQTTIKGDPSFAYIRIFFGGKAQLSGLAMKKIKGDATSNAPNKFTLSTKAGMLIDNGQPAASIILNGAKSDLRERFAAYELRRWVKKVTNTELPIFESDENVPGTKIYIGMTEDKDLTDKQFSDILTKLNDSEGYAIVKRDGNYHILGANSKGTLFGTWRFIEENLDLIWSRPLDYGAVFEKKNSVPVVSQTSINIPSFKMRSWSMPGGVQDNEITNLWYARNGANPGLTVIGYGPTHYLARMYGRSLRVGGGFMYGYLGKYKDTNPEFFPMTDGKRKLSNHAQPCFTNSLSVATIVKEAQLHMNSAPDDNVYLDCGNEDTWVCCECDTCLAPIKLPDGKILEAKSKFSEKDPLFRSTQLYMFLNAVAEGVEKNNPDTKITTLAYIFSAEYPAVPIHKNVLSLFAPYPTHNMRFPLRDSNSRGTAAGRTWAERFSDWCNSEAPLAFYEYLGNGYFNAMADAAAENLRDLKHKAKNPYGINSEALQDFDQNLYGIGNFKQLWDVNAINMWVITRLMWNPDQDVNALRKEFIRKTYREGAPQMTEFWNIIIKNWNDPKLNYSENCHSGRSGVFKRYIVDTGDEKKLRSLLTEAEKAAKNPNSKLLIQDIIKSFDEWSNSLGRVIVPEISEASSEAMNINTPHWEKAVKLDNFILPRQYNVKAEERKRATNPTQVSFMRDGETLYVKFSCETPADYSKLEVRQSNEFPVGEHVELQFRIKGQLYLFAVAPDGRFYYAKNWVPQSKIDNIKYVTQGDTGKWSAVMAIKFSDLNFKPEESLKSPLEVVISRITELKSSSSTPQLEESTYKGVVPHGEHIWTPLTIE